VPAPPPLCQGGKGAKRQRPATAKMPSVVAARGEQDARVGVLAAWAGARDTSRKRNYGGR